ncbi:MAG: OmpA family protein [Bacteroidota bacterium]
MSTPVKWLIMLVIWLVYSLLTFNFCVRDACCTPCDDGVTTEETTSPPEETSVVRYPVNSQLGYAAVDTTDQFETWKDQILAQMEDGKILEVEGLYYASEEAPEGYANMGLARAEQTMSLLAAFIPTDRMRPVARLVDGQADGEAAGGDARFLSANTRWLDDDSNTNLEEEEVITISEDEQIILFPRAKAEAIRNQGVIDYLDELATYLKAHPDDRVVIIGHASATGKSDVNETLSRRRANRVKEMLTSRGVAEAQIQTQYKGDTELRDQGNSEEAHRRNRRAELKLIRSGN